MPRPQITLPEVLTIVKTAPELIGASLDRYVAKGRITQSEAQKYLLKASQRPQGAVYAIGIRGYYQDTMGKAGENDRGIYDDALVL